MLYPIFYEKLFALVEIQVKLTTSRPDLLPKAAVGSSAKTIEWL